MKPKLAGCCSKCDAEVFEVSVRDPETREPKRAGLGSPLENAVRATFVLMNGSRMDLTFCAACMDELTPADYAALWRRVVVSWVHETSEDPSWVRSQVDNGIAGLLHKQPWREVV